MSTLVKMKKIIKPAIWLFSFLAVFISGIALGAYYRDELLVYWSAWLQPHYSPVAPPSTSAAQHTSVINLPTLEQPLPLVYSDTLDETVIQKYLREGAVVLPLGTIFGKPGNSVITAHSSGTQSYGPYRFAFARLAELKEGDTFSITTPTAKYSYRVYGKEIVWPHQVDRLPQDDRSTVTLVTCWPLWTNFKRLLVHSELTSVDYQI